jgi:hypothetical protein
LSKTLKDGKSDPHSLIGRINIVKMAILPKGSTKSMHQNFNDLLHRHRKRNLKNSYGSIKDPKEQK